jgi:hypothetical protein
LIAVDAIPDKFLATVLNVTGDLAAAATSPRWNTNLWATWCQAPLTVGHRVDAVAKSDLIRRSGRWMPKGSVAIEAQCRNTG